MRWTRNLKLMVYCYQVLTSGESRMPSRMRVPGRPVRKNLTVGIFTTNCPRTDSIFLIFNRCLLHSLLSLLTQRIPLIMSIPGNGRRPLVNRQKDSERLHGLEHDQVAAVIPTYQGTTAVDLRRPRAYYEDIRIGSKGTVHSIPYEFQTTHTL